MWNGKCVKKHIHSLLDVELGTFYSNSYPPTLYMVYNLLFRLQKTKRFFSGSWTTFTPQNKNKASCDLTAFNYEHLLSRYIKLLGEGDS